MKDINKNDIENIFNEIIQLIADIPVPFESDKFNERYFHHMFSNLLYEKYGRDIWKNLYIKPEYNTCNQKFSWGSLKKYLDEDKDEIKNIINNGQQGSFDFYIGNNSNNEFFIEWKGPKNCTLQNLVEVFMKLLLKKENENAYNIFMYITLVESKKDTKRFENHIDNIIDKLNNSKEIARNIYLKSGNKEKYSEKKGFIFLCNYSISSKQGSQKIARIKDL